MARLHAGAVMVAVLVACHALLSVSAATSPMQTNVDAKTGAFTITVGGSTWLSGHETAVQAGGMWHSSSNGGLKMAAAGTAFQGGDSVGAYEATQITWLVGASTGTRAGPGATAPRMVTTVRVYTDVDAVVFEQRFPDGLEATSVGDTDQVLSSFPTFDKTLPQSDGLGYTSFFGEFIADSHSGHWWNNTEFVFGGKSGGPFVVFDHTMSNSLVVSPFSQFMAASFYEDTTVSPKSVRCGVMGGVESIPPGYTLETIVYHGAGFNQAMEEWGALLLNRYNKPSQGALFDYTTRNLGYNTDHGTYYYYHTEPGKNYLETLTDVYHYAEKEGIPYKFILLDSWWYYKGDRDGVYNWTAMPSIFPGGNAGMQNLTLTTNWHVIAHNRYWSDNTNYAKQNGGEWDFVVEPQNQLSIPVEEAFWEYLMSSSRRWGLDVYEQDWLYNEFDWMNVTLSNATIARMWLLQMGNAAERNGVNIQYCMPYPRHALQSVEIPAVTQIRASPDYVPGSIVQQWQIGVSSILAHALALAPFKDNFWSTTNQPGNPYIGAKEPYPELEACVATLSTGPVTPGDGIGYTNVSLVMRSCSTSGMLLQPDRPATAVDATMLQQAFGSGGPQGQLWSTYSDVGYYRWNHIFAAEMVSPYQVHPATLAAQLKMTTSNMVAYSMPTNSLDIGAIAIAAFSASSPIAVPVCGRADFHLSHVAPQFASGWSLLGELDKWVPVSGARFRSVQQDPSGITVQLAGKVGEVVHVTFADPSLKLVQVDAVIQSNGRAVVTQSTVAGVPAVVQP